MSAEPHDERLVRRLADPEFFAEFMAARERRIRADERKRIRRAVRRLQGRTWHPAGPGQIWAIDVLAILKGRDERARKEAGR